MAADAAVATAEPPSEAMLGSAAVEPESLLPVGTPTPHPPAATLESTDPRLEEALAREAAAPGRDAFLAVADSYRRLGVLDLAHARYTAARLADPRSAAAYDGLARIWRDWGMPHLALGDAHRAVYYAPDSASAVNTLGTVLHAAGQVDAARQAYTRALALDADATYALNNLCYLELEVGRPDVAIETCGRALALDGSLTVARNNLALAHAARGDLVAAGLVLAGLHDPATRDYNLGMLLLAHGEFEPAIRAFDEAFRQRPSIHSSTRARQARELLRARNKHGSQTDPR